MIDFDKMRLKMSLIVTEGTFTEEQTQELHDIVNKIETPGLKIISPLKAVGLIKNATKNADLFEAKYLEYGGNPEKIKSIGEDIIKDIKELLPGISSLGQIKRKLSGGK